MAYLTKNKVKEIIKNAPSGTTPEGVVAALRSKGHELEGYPTKKKEPQSGLQETKNPFTETITGLAKSAGRSILGIGTIGRNVQEGVARTVGIDLPETSVFDTNSPARQQMEERLSAKTKAERTAGFVGDVAQFGIPSSGVAKSVKGLGIARQILARAGVGAVTGTVQGGGEIGKETAISAGTELAFPVAGKALSYGGNVMKGLLGLVSGRGSDVIEQVIKTPRAALEGGEQAGIQGLKESAMSVRQGVKSLSKKAGDDYAVLVQKAGVKQLPKKDIVDGVSKRLAELSDGTLTKEGGIKFVDTPFTEAEEKQLQKVFNNVNNWEDFSPSGVNSLARKINRFRRGGQDSANFDRVIDTVKRDLREYVGKVAPTIKEANTKFADKMDLIDQLDFILKTDDAVNSRLGIQKTAESIGRLFNANKDIAREGVEEIEKELGINILGKEAGRQLVDGVSRSQSAIGDFATGVSRALLPPKVVLNITARTGIAKEVIENRLQGLEPAVRGAVLEVLTDFFGD